MKGPKMCLEIASQYNSVKNKPFVTKPPKRICAPCYLNQ